MIDQPEDQKLAKTSVEEPAGAAAETMMPPPGHDGSELPSTAPGRPAAAPEARPTPLLVDREASDMRARWSAIQTGFVDDPRHAVEMADSLVAEMMQRLAQLFANQRGQLEGQWSRGEDVSTEDLRIALRQYRSFFDRLLSI